MQVVPVTLSGRHVELQPLAPAHLDDLFEASRDDAVWQFLPEHRPETRDAVRAWLDAALLRRDEGRDLPFAIVWRESGKAIGSTRLLDVSPAYRHAEIGWSWLSSAHWRTAANTESKYLLLRHAFETWGCIRVQLKTDLRNERSQRAIERLGAVREGVLRKAVIVKDGYQRSSVYYSIIDDEWPVVKTNLESKLGLVQA